MIRGNPITLGGGAPKGKTLSDLAEGALVSVRENGILRPFYVAKHDYEPDLNGAGRTLLVKKDLAIKKQMTSSANTYANGAADTWMNGDYADMLSAEVRANIGLTSFKYTAGNGATALSTLQRAVFTLSLAEMGITHNAANAEGMVLPIAGALSVAYLNGVANDWWLRTPVKTNNNAFFTIKSTGELNSTVANDTSIAIRPCFTLPGTMEVMDEPNADGSYSLLCDAVVDIVSELPTGALVNIEENGVPVPFYVAKHNYESSLNGAGRTLLVRKDCYDTRQWNSTSVNEYSTSGIDSFLNGEYKEILSGDVQAAMGLTMFPYTKGNTTTVSNLARSVFLLSVAEIGDTGTTTEGTVLPIASALKIAYLNGTTTTQWLRTPWSGANFAYFVQATGGITGDNATSVHGSRPCFTIPYNTKIVTTPNADGSYDLDI